MGGGRKNLKREVEDNNVILNSGQSIMQAVSRRGTNIIEVMDAKREKSLARFPAIFKNAVMIKIGNFVVVDGKGREEALKAGSKVACSVSRLLFHEQVRRLEKLPDWPEAFKVKASDTCTKAPQGPAPEHAEESEDDGLPPLEPNMNRVRPFELNAGSPSDSDSDSDS